MILDSIAQREKRNLHRAYNMMFLQVEFGEHNLGKSEFSSTVISLTGTCKNNHTFSVSLKSQSTFEKSVLLLLQRQ